MSEIKIKACESQCSPENWSVGVRSVSTAHSVSLACLPEARTRGEAHSVDWIPLLPWQKLERDPGCRRREKHLTLGRRRDLTEASDSLRDPGNSTGGGEASGSLKTALGAPSPLESW
ncbi:General Transcription Factor Ii-I Repeat Domain-Containing Protein 2B [Manis pentadactyla]|nr:General Transcription Factor Ii-I Repeat Domain-Containing Protein 2B [Manis pentadactyla]